MPGPDMVSALCSPLYSSTVKGKGRCLALIKFPACTSADKDHADRREQRDDIMSLLLLLHCSITGWRQGQDLL